MALQRNVSGILLIAFLVTACATSSSNLSLEGYPQGWPQPVATKSQCVDFGGHYKNQGIALGSKGAEESSVLSDLLFRNRLIRLDYAKRETILVKAKRSGTHLSVRVEDPQGERASFDFDDCSCGETFLSCSQTLNSGAESLGIYPGYYSSSTRIWIAEATDRSLVVRARDENFYLIAIVPISTASTIEWARFMRAADK